MLNSGLHRYTHIHTHRNMQANKNPTGQNGGKENQNKIEKYNPTWRRGSSEETSRGRPSKDLQEPIPKSQTTVDSQGLGIPSSIHFLLQWLKPEPLLVAPSLQYRNMDSEIKLKFLCYLPSSESELFPGDYSRYANRRSPDSAVLNK